MQDRLNYELGIYLSYAFNNPKKYPKKPFHYKEITSKRIMTDEEISDTLSRLAKRKK